VERLLHLHRAQINSVEFLNGVRNVLKRDNVVEAISIATPRPARRAPRQDRRAQPRSRSRSASAKPLKKPAPRRSPAPGGQPEPARHPSRHHRAAARPARHGGGRFIHIFRPDGTGRPARNIEAAFQKASGRRSSAPPPASPWPCPATPAYNYLAQPRQRRGAGHWSGAARKSSTRHRTNGNGKAK